MNSCLHNYLILVNNRVSHQTDVKINDNGFLKKKRGTFLRININWSGSEDLYVDNQFESQSFAAICLFFCMTQEIGKVIKNDTSK